MAQAAKRKTLPVVRRYYGVRIFGGIEEADRSRPLKSAKAVERWFQRLHSRHCFDLEEDLPVLISVRGWRLDDFRVLPRKAVCPRLED